MHLFLITSPQSALEWHEVEGVAQGWALTEIASWVEVARPHPYCSFFADTHIQRMYYHLPPDRTGPLMGDIGVLCTYFPPCDTTAPCTAVVIVSFTWDM